MADLGKKLAKARPFAKRWLVRVRSAGPERAGQLERLALNTVRARAGVMEAWTDGHISIMERGMRDKPKGNTALGRLLTEHATERALIDENALAVGTVTAAWHWWMLARFRRWRLKAEANFEASDRERTTADKIPFDEVRCEQTERLLSAALGHEVWVAPVYGTLWRVHGGPELGAERSLSLIHI